MHLTSFLPDLTAYEDHGREWYSLLHVCRQWRGIIARSPTLWSTIDNTLVEDAHNSVAHERYLYRSGGAPLIVYLGVKDTKIRRKSLQALLKHVSRFKELHLIADLWEDSSTPIYTLLVDPAPTLCSLTLRTDGKDVVGGVLPPIFAGEMPRLRELTLEHFTSWPTNYFHNLTSLSLSDQPFHRPTDPSVFGFFGEFTDVGDFGAGTRWSDSSFQHGYPPHVKPHCAVPPYASNQPGRLANTIYHLPLPIIHISSI
ncbi:hypothetical protein BT96DRAFT_60600 [Gymnopus androsaceus JB14]|uniref:Uncharacterized protein n=1 Tax=Gymnopus androsaceus JB14 TaxID=1447944 RepID=A0A6A4HLL9_9AGAR|nr:hypothetical protein BT96DRAFT_60600 [Gymnopus androsaceus JB14]